ncbi:MAG: type VI secretion system baseplate subunit TssG [Alphaproteobacteria bacterium]|nr:type VI secretion system baseplate subunit TssG [Alphaproteobacteria bacterium]
MSDPEPLHPNRRLAAILAADIAGYSRLMGEDEEGTLRRVKAIQAGLFEPKIAAHRGRLVKTTGDGFLIEFSSVVDALRCACEVQAEMAERDAKEPPDRRIQFRIGIHQGDIVFDNNDIFGNGVNIAARLEGIAEPGGICVSARVQEDAVGRIELAFEDIGEQKLKNIARPVRAYRVRAPGDGAQPAPAAADITAAVERVAESIEADRIELAEERGGAPARQPPRKLVRSPYDWLFAEPRRFRFDAAVRLLTSVAKNPDPSEAVRFRSAPGLAYPTAEVAAIEPRAEGRSPQLTTSVIGLIGTAGVLPRLYTEVLTTTLRNRSRALHDFLDLLSHRVVGMFARAGVKYRLNRAAEAETIAKAPGAGPVTEALLAFTGFATPHLVPRVKVGSDPLLHYAGLFAGRPRSAEKLAALVSDWLGRKVEVLQFAGAWLDLPVDQRSSLARGRHPGRWNRLSVDAAAGVRAWDPQARIILRVGPLDLKTFASLLPDHSGLQHLVALVRAFLGFETAFAVNPVLAGPEVPPLLLDATADPAPRLGWNTWMPGPELPIPGIRRPDAADALFEAEIVEAEEIAAQARR